jgi:spermidine synthase
MMIREHRSNAETALVSDASGTAFLGLLFLFCGSGCAALIYEIVWFQLLQVVIGASAISLGLLLAAYMGGLCWGSAAFRHVALPAGGDRWRSMRVYAVLELGIGILGLAVLYGVPGVARLYAAVATQGLTGLVVRGAVASLCLLPPTLLMGASLPALARQLETTPRGVSRIGWLYSANIAGAVAGCLLAGFYLLRVHDMAVATYIAAGLNFAVAGSSFVWASRAPGMLERPRKWEAALRAPGTRRVYLAIALSGLSALGAEVIWTRLLSLLLGATVYTFSIILAVFLLGLGGGSSLGSLVAGRTEHPRVALAGCQILLALAIAWTAYTLSHSLPYWPLDPWLSRDPWFNFELDLARCTWAIFPATLLWGASFPLALASAAVPGQDPARLSGELYAANTAGSITGALLFSLVLIPSVGTAASERVLIGLAMASAVSAGVPLLSRARAVGWVVAATVAGVLLGWTVTDVPWQMVAYGRRIAPILRGEDLFDQAHPTKVLFRGEGINSSVVIAERAGQRHFYVSGKAEASTAPLDMRLERMMGHVPALIASQPRSVLVVGFGAGITAGSFVPYPEVTRLVICELEPLIPQASTQYFGPENRWVMQDRRTHIIYDDARHYIFTSRDKFDVITTDPIHPWVKGTSTLYSFEYYQLVKAHLNRGGVVAQWLPIYDSDPDTVRTELATFFEVFPDGTVWSNNINGDGYDLVLIGEANASPINVDLLQHRLDRSDYVSVSQSLAEVGFHSAVDVLATYAGRASDLRPYLSGAQINNDLNLRLQYLAGLGLNSMAFQGIYRQILRYRRFPEGVLIGSPGGRMDALHTLLSVAPHQ